MFGSLIMLHSGVNVIFPKNDRLSGTRWDSLSVSGKAAKMRPATLMSQGIISIFEMAEN